MSENPQIMSGLADISDINCSVTTGPARPANRSGGLPMNRHQERIAAIGFHWSDFKPVMDIAATLVMEYAGYPITFRALKPGDDVQKYTGAIIHHEAATQLAARNQWCDRLPHRVVDLRGLKPDRMTKETAKRIADATRMLLTEISLKAI